MIYFIQSGDDGLIKIGRSDNVKQRVITMQSDSPEELRILGVVDEQAESEDRIHERFEHLQYRGEWYHPGDELLQYIDTNAGAPDEQVLRIQISTTVSDDTRDLYEGLILAYGGGRGAGRVVLQDALRLLAAQKLDKAAQEAQPKPQGEE